MTASGSADVTSNRPAVTASGSADVTSNRPAVTASGSADERPAGATGQSFGMIKDITHDRNPDCSITVATSNAASHINSLFRAARCAGVFGTIR